MVLTSKKVNAWKRPLKWRVQGGKAPGVFKSQGRKRGEGGVQRRAGVDCYVSSANSGEKTIWNFLEILNEIP